MNEAASVQLNSSEKKTLRESVSACLAFFSFVHAEGYGAHHVPSTPLMLQTLMSKRTSMLCLVGLALPCRDIVRLALHHTEPEMLKHNGTFTDNACFPCNSFAGNLGGKTSHGACFSRCAPHLPNLMRHISKFSNTCIALFASATMSTSVTKATWTKRKVMTKFFWSLTKFSECPGLQVVPLKASSPVATHHEIHDLEAARRYVRGNVACVLQYLQEKTKTLKNKGKAGRHPADIVEKIAGAEKLTRKIESRENTLNILVQSCSFAENLTPSKKRRMSTKSSSSTAPRPIAAASQTGVFSERQEIKYERSFEGLVRTRAYARGPKIGAQRMPRVVQRLLCPNTHDLDIENSVFVILHQLLLRLNEDKSIPTMVMETMEACAKNRSAICKEKLGMSVEKGKEALHTVLFGGQIPLTLRRPYFCAGQHVRL